MNTRTIISDFNKIATLPERKWSTNSHFHKYLLAHIPKNCGSLLDVGCGTGNFCRLLETHADSILGIDVSSKMIDIAKSKNKANNTSFIRADYLNFADFKYNCIVSIATVHHLNLEDFIKKVKQVLNDNGKLIILDLYKKTTVDDYLLSIVSMPLSKLMSWYHNGFFSKVPLEERMYWKEHAKNDRFYSIKEIKEICDKHLPGYKLKRHLFWRYSLTWSKIAN